MYINLCEINKSDYYIPKNYIIECTQVITGNRLLNSIISMLSSAIYTNYFNSKIFELNIIFYSAESAETFYNYLSEVDLKHASEEDKFFKAIQYALLRSDMPSIYTYSIELKDQKISQDKIFKAEINDNIVTILVENNKIYYIYLYSLDGYPTNTIDSIMQMSDTYLSEYLLTLDDFFYSKQIVESSVLLGNLFGIYTVINNDVYLISDYGFHIINSIKNVNQKLYDLNNIDIIDKYIEDNPKSWNKFSKEYLDI